MHVATCNDPRCPLPIKGKQTSVFVSACVEQTKKLYLPTLRRLHASKGDKVFAMDWLKGMAEDFPEVTQQGAQHKVRASKPAPLKPRPQASPKAQTQLIPQTQTAPRLAPSIADLD